MREKIHELEVNLNNLLSFPCSRRQRDANSRQRDKESLNSSTQAKPSLVQLEEQLEGQHRQGAGVQPYPVIT